MNNNLCQKSLHTKYLFILRSLRNESNRSKVVKAPPPLKKSQFSSKISKLR